MKQHINNAGGKHWYGSHWVELQAESLDAIQGLASSLGAHVLAGCAIAVNGSAPQYDIAAGIVAINHADGFKIARFAGATNQNLSAGGYLSIAKAAVNGVYNSGADVIAYDYTATFTAGAAPNSSALYLPIPDPATGLTPRKLTRAIGKAATTTTTTIAATGFVGSLDFSVNEAARTLRVKGVLNVDSIATRSGNGSTHPVFQVQLPVEMRPASRQYFTAFVEYNTANANKWFKDYTNSSYITQLTGYVDPDGGVWLIWLRPVASVASYDVNINAVLSLD
jgi:hypothetical protein